MDMNENNPNQGVSIDELLKVIGLRDVEGYVRDQNMAKLQEQAVALAKQNASLNAELTTLKGKGVAPAAPSPEVEQLRKSNAAGEARVKQLEDQVHAVALERDAARAQANADLKKERDRYTDLQYVCDDLQKEVDSLKAEKPKSKKK
jgi:hypothetical protein